MDVSKEIKNAIALSKKGEFKKAEALYKTILQDDSSNLVAQSCLGLLYYTAGKYKKAEKLLEKVYSINKSKILAECIAFTKKYLEKDYEVVKYCKDIPLEEKSNKLLELEIFTLIDVKYINDANELAKYYYEKNPLSKDTLYVYAFSLLASGKFDTAENIVKQLINYFPKYFKTWYVAGLLYEMLYHNDKLAFECYKKQLRSGDKSAYWNMAISMFKQNDFKRTSYYLNKLVNIEGKGDKYYFLKASCYFKRGNFKKGYKLYVRKMNYMLKDIDNLKFLPLKKQWHGKRYSKETLLVYDDQGAGDTIMFARYLPLLKNKFKKIKVIVKSNMLDLFNRSGIFPDNFEVIGKNNLKKAKLYKIKYDKFAFLSELPYFLKTDMDTIPHPEGYLIPDNNKIEVYKEKYFNTDKLKVGLCWEAGGAAWREQLNRTLHISVFDEILNIDNINYYSVQKAPMFDIFKDYNITDVGTSFEDFDDTAAALMNLDVLITVDTSVAHLAGAIGIKTFLILPYISDWRWFDDTETTPWYKSVRIFKQTDNISYSREIKLIKNELLSLLRDYKHL